MRQRMALIEILILMLSLLLLGADNGDKFKELLEEGISLFEEGDFEGAIDKLRSAIILSGPKAEMAKAYMLVGISYLAMGGQKEAESCFEFAVKLKPNLQMPEGYPPKAIKLFENVRKRLLGKLILRTNPPETKVYLDDRYVGRTDQKGRIEIFPILIGRHRLELRKTHYHDLVKEIIVKSGDNPMEYTLRKIRVQLRLRTEPIGAEIMLDGKFVGRSPINLDVDEDAQPTLTVRYPTYREFSGKVRIAEGKVSLGEMAFPIRRSAASILIKLEKLPPGALYVSSDPAKAEVYLDGKFMGLTPLKLDEVEVGGHRIELFKDGFDRLQDEVMIESAETTVYRALLGGRIEVSSVPDGAEVILNGQKIGLTPVKSQQLPPGSYAVLIRKPGFRDIWEEVTVSTGKTVELIGRLRPYTGALWISSEPKGASIFVDGRFSGRTPRLIYGLKVGEHEIRLEKETRSWSGKVKIRRNRIAYLSPRMRSHGIR
jgi:hypothetical protein